LTYARIITAAACAAGAAALAVAGASCAIGRESHRCFANDTCFAGLTCLSHRCVVLPDGLVRGGARGGDGTGSAGAGAEGSDAAAGGSVRDGSSRGARGDGHADDPARTEGAISLAAFSRTESETDVAVAPGGRLAAAWISSAKRHGASKIAYAFSSDGGATWTTPLVADAGAAADSWDPALAADAHGGFHLAWGGGRRGPDGRERGIFVASAAPGATSFGPPVRVSAPASKKFDKPTIAVTRRGTLLVTYDLSDGRGSAVAARSDDGGATWTRAPIPPARKRGRWLFAVCAPPTGDRVWVTFASKEGIGLQWSSDDGRTWPAAEGAVSAPEETDAFAEMQSSTCAGDGRNVWVLYGISPDRGGEDELPRSTAIRVARSRDGGRTFGERHDAHDRAAGSLYMLPKLVREPGGALDVAYYAGSGDRHATGSFVWSRSTDGGATFAPALPIRGKIELDKSRSSKTWLGDYVGLTFRDGTLYTSYVDNGSGEAHVVFARAPAAGAPPPAVAAEAEK